jgi:hypothetical protein
MNFGLCILKEDQFFSKLNSNLGNIENYDLMTFLNGRLGRGEGGSQCPSYHTVLRSQYILWLCSSCKIIHDREYDHNLKKPTYNMA